MITEQSSVLQESPQTRRKAQTKQAIIDNVSEMIAEEGIEGLSIRALAKRIDFSPGAIYRYFDSKEDLIDAVRADCFERLNASLSERIQVAANAADMLMECGMAYIEYAGHYPEEYHLMFSMEPSKATSGEHRDTAMRSLLQIIKFGISQGEFVIEKGYGADIIAYHCWATVHGIASLQAGVKLDESEDWAKSSRSIMQKVIDGFSSQIVEELEE